MTPTSIGYDLKRAQDALNRSMTAILSEVGLSVPQYAILYTLDQTPGISSAELARRSFVTPQTMNELVLVLERAGLVARRAHPTHGRIQQAYLTADGRAKLATANRRIRTIEDRMLSSLNNLQRRELAAWLSACADSLQSEELPRSSVTARRPAHAGRDGRLDDRLSWVAPAGTRRRRRG